MSRLYQINEEDLRALEGATPNPDDLMPGEKFDVAIDPWKFREILDRVRYPEAPKDEAQEG